MKQSDIELLKQIDEYEETHKVSSLGWCWRDVRIYPATLNRFVVKGFLDIVFSSNTYTGYKLTDKGKALAKGLEMEEKKIETPLQLPDDLFSEIIGYEDIKELLRAILLAIKPVHLLLYGPPALAKSLFLWELERAVGERALWVLGSASSKAGLQEAVLEKKPWLLLIDEIDKMDGKDQAALLSLMEMGRVVRTKVGRMADEIIEVKVVAACNDISKLPPELVSRFATKRLYPYSSSEFTKVVVGVLTRREGIEPSLAEEIAKRLNGRTQDVRDAVRVARLSSQLGIDRAIKLLLD